MTLDQYKYPIGKFKYPKSFDSIEVSKCIKTIENFTLQLNTEVENISQLRLDTPYRDGGWTVRQVIHHCADSHMNAFIRCKLALTENNPVIKPYFEDKWAELPDSKSLPIESSLLIIKGLHFRWVELLNSLKETQLKLKYIHPEHGREFLMYEVIALYAWHCNHHLAHIKLVK